MSRLQVIERAAAAVYAGAAALLPLLIDQHVISAAVGTDIGVTVAAVAAGWQGGRLATRRGAAATDAAFAAHVDQAIATHTADAPHGAPVGGPA